MSLLTDAIFIEALNTDQQLMSMLAAGDVYGTTIALPDEDIMNAPLPYCIVTYDGMNNDPGTKDDYEGDYDQVRIGVTVAAKTRAELARLIVMVRNRIRDYFSGVAEEEIKTENEGLVPYDYTLQSSPVQYDMLKPCYWQTLTYSCDTLATDTLPT